MITEISADKIIADGMNKQATRFERLTKLAGRPRKEKQFKPFKSSFLVKRQNNFENQKKLRQKRKEDL